MFPNELVELPDDTLKDADPVRPNRVQHLIHANRAYLLRLTRLLYEHLLVQIVVIVAHESLRFSQQLHNVDPLFELLVWQVRIANPYPELVLGEDPHVLVGAKVVRAQRRHLIEGRPEVLLDLVTHIDLLLKDEQIVHASILGQVDHSLLKRI